VELRIVTFSTLDSPPDRAVPDPIPDEVPFATTIEFVIVIVSIFNGLLEVEVPDPIAGEPKAETEAFTKENEKHPPSRLTPKPGTASAPSDAIAPVEADVTVTFEPKHSTAADRPDPETLRNSFAPSAIKTTELSEISSGAGKVTETPERTTVASVLFRRIP
jgi:hypothetical protein